MASRQFTASAVATASGATARSLFTASRARDISYGDGAAVAGEDFPSLPEVTAARPVHDAHRRRRDVAELAIPQNCSRRRYPPSSSIMARRAPSSERAAGGRALPR